MYLTDYHTHSRVSPDAEYPMTTMAAAAVKAGLHELCFTDHVEPIRWGTVQPLEHYDWAPMARDFAEAQTAWGQRLRLRLGVELGDAPWDFSVSETLLAQGPELDFVIGSIHALSARYDGLDLYYFNPKDEAEARLGLSDYLEQVQKLADWGQFDVLGHLTVPLRYLNENRGFHLTLDGFEDRVETILRTLIQNGCGIELNTNRGNTPLPDAKYLRMYRRLGGERITLGSDAHDPTYVGCAIGERQRLLRECGFTRFCTFEKRQPIWHML